MSRITRRSLVAAALAAPALPAAAGAAVGPLPVELFTSQGCSSCPPADAALARLVGRADVLPLAFHVTYWDRLGWPDSFGDRRWTERQRWYAERLGTRGLYTPQLVVAGEVDLVGSDPRLERLLPEVAKLRMPGAVTLTSDGRAELPAMADVAGARLLAIAFTRLATVDVARGENAGRRLDYHHIVRDLVDLGTWDGAARPVDLPALPPGADGRAVLLQAQSGRVLASGMR